MDRTLYLNLSKQYAINKANHTLSEQNYVYVMSAVYKEIPFYPDEYILTFNKDGQAVHTAGLKYIDCNAREEFKLSNVFIKEEGK